jgi:hypothetical protein
MREVLAVTVVSLLAGGLFGVAGPMDVEQPTADNPGITALQSRH